MIYLIQSKGVLSFRKSFKQPIKSPLLGLNYHFKLTLSSYNTGKKWMAYHLAHFWKWN